VLAKVQKWFDAGCRAVWVADPRTRTVTVCRSRSEIVVLGESETLSGGDLLPNFSLPVSDVFQG
jgi:Uma2 family endonuclease